MPPNSPLELPAPLTPHDGRKGPSFGSDEKSSKDAPVSGTPAPMTPMERFKGHSQGMMARMTLLKIESKKEAAAANTPGSSFDSIPESPAHKPAVSKLANVVTTVASSILDLQRVLISTSPQARTIDDCARILNALQVLSPQLCCDSFVFPVLPKAYKLKVARSLLWRRVLEREGHQFEMRRQGDSYLYLLIRGEASVTCELAADPGNGKSSKAVRTRRIVAPGTTFGHFSAPPNVAAVATYADDVKTFGLPSLSTGGGAQGAGRAAAKNLPLVVAAGKLGFSVYGLNGKGVANTAAAMSKLQTERGRAPSNASSSSHPVDAALPLGDSDAVDAFFDAVEGVDPMHAAAAMLLGPSYSTPERGRASDGRASPAPNGVAAAANTTTTTAKGAKGDNIAGVGRGGSVTVHFKPNSEYIILRSSDCKSWLSKLSAKLATLSLLEDLGLRFMEKYVKVLTLPKRTVLVREGHRPNYVYAILEGAVEIVKDRDTLTPQQIRQLQRESGGVLGGYAGGGGGMDGDTLMGFDAAIESGGGLHGDNDDDGVGGGGEAGGGGDGAGVDAMLLESNMASTGGGDAGGSWVDRGKAGLSITGLGGRKLANQSREKLKVILPSGFVGRVESGKIAVVGSRSLVGEIPVLLEATHPVHQASVITTSQCTVLQFVGKEFEEKLDLYKDLKKAFVSMAKSRQEWIEDRWKSAKDTVQKSEEIDMGYVFRAQTSRIKSAWKKAKKYDEEMERRKNATALSQYDIYHDSDPEESDERSRSPTRSGERGGKGVVWGGDGRLGSAEGATTARTYRSEDWGGADAADDDDDDRRLLQLGLAEKNRSVWVDIRTNRVVVGEGNEGHSEFRVLFETVFQQKVKKNPKLKKHVFLEELKRRLLNQPKKDVKVEWVEPENPFERLNFINEPGRNFKCGALEWRPPTTVEIEDEGNILDPLEPFPTITRERKLHGKSMPLVSHSEGYECPFRQQVLQSSRIKSSQSRQRPAISAKDQLEIDRAISRGFATQFPNSRELATLELPTPLVARPSTGRFSPDLGRMSIASASESWNGNGALDQGSALSPLRGGKKGSLHGSVSTKSIWTLRENKMLKKSDREYLVDNDFVDLCVRSKGASNVVLPEKRSRGKHNIVGGRLC